MKKFSSILLFAIMCFATMGFTACGGDDDGDVVDGGSGGNVADYLEVDIDGTKYRQQYSLPFVAITLPREVDRSLWLSSSVEEDFNGNLDFAIAIYHKSNMNDLLHSSASTYNVIGNQKTFGNKQTTYIILPFKFIMIMVMVMVR